MISTNGVPAQIPLRFGQFQKIDFDSFIAGDNQAPVELLQNIAANNDHRHVYLWGAAGSGKSHLLQAACKLASLNHLQVAYVPLEYIADFSPDMLHDLGMLDLVCVDDLEKVTTQKDWQQSLVWLYNELRDNGHSLLIAGEKAPQVLDLEVEDLRSRLGWDLVFQIKQPDDSVKVKILQQNAMRRSFELSNEVCEYLINRVDRNLDNLIRTLDKIDELSLAEQRKITIPFIKKILEQA